MKLSVCFMTGRDQPRLDWAILALGSQSRPDDEIEIIVIDALAIADTAEYRAGEADPTRIREHLIGGRELAILRQFRQFQRVLVVPPKPNVWQGKHRVTSCDWWATSNARNTFLCLARHEHLAFLDDRARPGSGWFATVRKAAATRASVIAGSYDKLEGPEDARITSRDHRRGISPSGRVDCGGGWLYGCTFTLPLEWALEVNGFEEGCDGLTGEDYIFGLMLGNAGRRIDFDPALFVLQDRQPGNETCKGTYACRDKGTSPNDKSHAALARFGGRKRTEFTPDLRALRTVLQGGGTFPLPDPHQRDWYDGELVAEMVRQP